MQKKREINDYIEEVHDYCLDVANRCIFIHKDFSNDEDASDIDYKSCMRLIKNLHILEKTSLDPIFIITNNLGGYIYDGLGMYDVIKNSKCHITMTCYGACMSAGSVILQAADTRISAPNCCFMLHEGYNSVDHTHKQSIEWIKNAQIERNKLLDIYINKMSEAAFFTGYNKNKIRTFIKNKYNTKEDWVMYPEDALKYGLIDKIL